MKKFVKAIDNKNIDNKNIDNMIINYILNFYDAYYKSDNLRIYSYLNTAFQREVSLNYFLIHPDYNIDLGTLIEITNIRKENNTIAVEITVQINNNLKDIVITVMKDFGGWKIDGDSIYRGNYS